ncbi:recombination regulator RecX [Clostridium manihotivorum]|uniref:Regulatory protein RecX n=1 Tax=Clostridium manihotivorum TaxID=2320868 RepID=A0A3R5QTG7_9CLOT|nr:recombination regulator RecX [Clostridium manihotivorum]QAA31941.1 recombination regulator RecX [Clostridium manihotivorum]
MNKITNIEVQKRNKNRVNVYIDEEFSFACEAELIYRYGLKKDTAVEIDKLKSIIEEEDFLKCKNSALRVIERSHKTEKEIKDKLFEKGFPEPLIKRTLEFLREYNFVDDKMYVEMYLKEKINTQGKNKIYYNLLRKGVSEELLKDKINNINTEAENDGAYTLCKKKYESLAKREEDKFKISQKLFRFMASKGYEFDMINRLIKEVMNTDQFME